MSSEKHLGFELSTSNNRTVSITKKGVFIMFYNKILRVWVVDPLDYFLLSAILGSIVASRLKDYLFEKKAMERLKTSIIKNQN